MGFCGNCWSHISQKITGTLSVTKNKKQFQKAEECKINGRVVLTKKGILDFHDFQGSIFDRIHELLGKGVSIQLISAVTLDPANGQKGKLGRVAYLERWNSTISSPATNDENAEFSVKFDWDENFGVPGAFIIKNHHHAQFFLQTVTLEEVPGHGPVHFVCNSWVYPSHLYKHDRIFFANKTYLPSQTPEPLRQYREQELVNLRGNGTGELKEWERVYDYAYYNDLGNPEKGKEYARPVLGGSKEYPYPRRGRTGRKPNRKGKLATEFDCVVEEEDQKWLSKIS